jgi:hypothetical protein
VGGASLQPFRKLETDFLRVPLRRLLDYPVQFVVPRPLVFEGHPRVPEITLRNARLLTHYTGYRAEA